MAVQLRQPDANNLPSTTVLKETDIWKNWLTFGYAWFDNAIDLPDLTPRQGLCLVLKHKSGSGTVGVFNNDNVGGSGFVETPFKSDWHL